jgi:isoprenylcysteine carboxyl methyltransferase (ICMT) family protein YpbQ
MFVARDNLGYLPGSGYFLPSEVYLTQFRYEFAREGKRVYLIVANAAFCLSTIVWIFAEAVYAHTLPFALIAYPGMFITVILLGVYMNDLKVIWNARFYDP